eukprot:gene25999-11690_t
MASDTPFVYQRVFVDEDEDDDDEGPHGRCSPSGTSDNGQQQERSATEQLYSSTSGQQQDSSKDEQSASHNSDSATAITLNPEPWLCPHVLQQSASHKSDSASEDESTSGFAAERRELFIYAVPLYRPRKSTAAPSSQPSDSGGDALERGSGECSTSGTSGTSSTGGTSSIADLIDSLVFLPAKVSKVKKNAASVFNSMQDAKKGSVKQRVYKTGQVYKTGVQDR